MNKIVETTPTNKDICRAIALASFLTVVIVIGLMLCGQIATP